MKNKKSNLLAISLAIFLIIISITTVKLTTVHSDGQEIQLTIIEADYGDFDADGSEDDIIVKAIMDANFKGKYATYFYLDITLPSGLVYSFSFQTMLTFDGTPLLITITTYDTAIEAGWYSCKLTSILIYEDMIIYGSSTYTFDPPTEKGPGEPTAELSVSTVE